MLPARCRDLCQLEIRLGIFKIGPSLPKLLVKLRGFNQGKKLALFYVRARCPRTTAAHSHSS